MRTGARRAAAVAAIALGMSAWTPYGVAATLPAAERAEPVDLGGEPVEATTNPDDPTAVEAGLWRAALGPTETSGTHHFVYERTMQESTLHVGVVATSGDSSSDSIGIEVHAGEDFCASDDQSAASPTHAVFGAAVSVGADEPGGQAGICLDADALRIDVTRGYHYDEDGDLPYALKIVEEGPVTGVDPESLPPTPAELDYRVPDVGDAGASDGPAGGTSFDDAPSLEPDADGVTVRTDVAEGTEQLFRVPATWGQQVVAAARIPGIEDDSISGLPVINLRIVEPMRNTMGDAAADQSSYGYYTTEALTLSVAGLPLAYLNRWAGAAPVLPGDFWVAVAVAPTPEDRDAIEVPVELTVAVTGDPGAGAPSHQERVVSPSGGAAPEGYSSRTPYLVGGGEFAAVASGNPFEEPTEDSWWGPRRFAGLGLGLASLACCAVGAVWLARARRA